MAGRTKRRYQSAAATVTEADARLAGKVVCDCARKLGSDPQQQLLATQRAGRLRGAASRAASRLESDRWMLKNGAERGASRRSDRRSHRRSANPDADRW